MTTQQITTTATTDAERMEQTLYNLQALLDDTRTALETGDARRAQLNAQDIAERAARLAEIAGEHVAPVTAAEWIAAQAPESR